MTLRLEDWEYLLEHFPASKAAINKYQTLSGDDGDNSNMRANRGWRSPDRTPTSPSSRVSQAFMRGPSKASQGGPSKGIIGGSLDRSSSPTSQSSSLRSSSRKSNAAPDSNQQRSPDSIGSTATLLFEQLRQAALLIPDGQSQQDARSTESDTSIRSVEGYLVDKYHINQNYPVVPFTSTPNVDENEVGDSASRPSSRGIRVRYQDENKGDTQDSSKIVTDQQDTATDKKQNYIIAEISPKSGEKAALEQGLASEKLQREYLALEHIPIEESSDVSPALSVNQKASSPQKEPIELQPDVNDHTPIDSRKSKQTTFDRRVSEVYIPLENVSNSPSLKSVTEKNLASLDSDFITQDSPLLRQTSDSLKLSNTSIDSNISDINEPSTSKKYRKRKSKQDHEKK